jgi:hypothetical protein
VVQALLPALLGHEKHKPRSEESLRHRRYKLGRLRCQAVTALWRRHSCLRIPSTLQVVQALLPALLGHEKHKPRSEESLRHRCYKLGRFLCQAVTD